jgi:hypothetical protein
MSIVVNKADNANLNLASAYVDYLKSKAGELALYYETKYKLLEQNLQTEINKSKHDFEETLRKDLEVYEQNLNATNRTHMLEMLNFLDNKLSMLIDKILLKLGVYNVSSAQISDLIRIELSDLLKSRTVKVKANADTINYLKFCVEINGVIDAYEEDETIKDGSCIISDGMCVCSADIASVVTKIKAMFKGE